MLQAWWREHRSLYGQQRNWSRPSNRDNDWTTSQFCKPGSETSDVNFWYLLHWDVPRFPIGHISIASIADWPSAFRSERCALCCLQTGNNPQNSAIFIVMKPPYVLVSDEISTERGHSVRNVRDLNCVAFVRVMNVWLWIDCWDTVGVLVAMGTRALVCVCVCVCVRACERASALHYTNLRGRYTQNMKSGGKLCS
jgi:hypothetical protein